MHSHVLIFYFTDDSHQRDARHSQLNRAKFIQLKSQVLAARFSTFRHNIPCIIHPFPSTHATRERPSLLLKCRTRDAAEAGSTKSLLHASSRTSVLLSFARHNFPEHNPSILWRGKGLAVLERVAHKRLLRLLRLEAAFSHLVVLKKCGKAFALAQALSSGFETK